MSTEPVTPTKQAPPGVPHVYQALAAIQEELGAIEKDGNLPVGGGKAVKTHRLEAILNALGPLRAKHRLFLSTETVSFEQRVDPAVDPSRDGPTFHVLAQFRFRWISAVDGSVFECGPYLGEGRGRDDKGSNKASSGALKQCLLHVFGVYTEELLDTDHQPHPEQQRPAPDTRRLEAQVLADARYRQEQARPPGRPDPAPMRRPDPPQQRPAPPARPPPATPGGNGVGDPPAFTLGNAILALFPEAANQEGRIAAAREWLQNAIGVDSISKCGDEQMEQVKCALACWDKTVKEQSPGERWDGLARALQLHQLGWFNELDSAGRSIALANIAGVRPPAATSTPRRTPF